MSGDCNVNIAQTEEEITLEFEEDQCDACNETDCPGKQTDPGKGPSESEQIPNDDIEGILRNFDKSVDIARERIMAGEVKGFILIHGGQGGFCETSNLHRDARRSWYTTMAVSELKTLLSK